MGVFSELDIKLQDERRVPALRVHVADQLRDWREALRFAEADEDLPAQRVLQIRIAVLEPIEWMLNS